MQQYKYKAVDLNKKKFSGIFIAKNEKDLATELAKQGLFLVSATPYSGGTPSSFFSFGVGGKVKRGEITTFCRQFSTMINAGMSVVNCLELLKAQSFSAYFCKLLAVVYEDVKSGVMLSDALNKHKSVFPSFFRNMINVGEASGRLEQVFSSLADYYERDSAIKTKTKSAFAYPIVLGVMTLAIVLLMLVFVVPRFRESLSELNVAPNPLTAAIYNISDFLKDSWWKLLLGIIGVIFGFILFGKTPKGRYIYDWLKVRLPGIRKITIGLITARFARGFGLLLSSGMDITEAMDSVAIVFDNKDVEARFKKAVDDINKGANIALAFDNYKLFPQIMIQMIAVGERTATLDETLNRSCGFFDNAVETALNSIVNKIQPIMLLLMGGVIGVMFIAVYSPMISIMQGLT